MVEVGEGLQGSLKTEQNNCSNTVPKDGERTLGEIPLNNAAPTVVPDGRPVQSVLSPGVEQKMALLTQGHRASKTKLLILAHENPTNTSSHSWH